MAADRLEPVQPGGLALALYITTVIFSVSSTIVVGLRTYIRTRHNCIGLDDYLMCAGWAAYMGHNIIVSIGCHRGIGTMQWTLDTPQIQEANKYVVIWQLLYALTLALVKSSICVTVIRIAIEKKYVRILQILIAMSVALMSNVITDFAVAVIPMCLVRKLQMRRKLKLYAQLIMALGMLASIASIVRIPYSNAYMKPDNFIHSVANIILWTVVECGVGVVAGSLPSLRAFFKSLTKDWSTNDQSASHNTTDLLTIGRVRGRSNRTTEIELGTQSPGGNDSNDGAQNDDDSQRRIIVHVTKSFRVE
ncbi:integral membrane protein [Fusarium heterosporum]|uniref:Integral membrane protein n=1 Tax=Fusarium heterosporum TaxID=42747 RepID=A0A8H5TAA7_FUSHE|nr:integral membrane protein [Fusarium heterosporum]